MENHSINEKLLERVDPNRRGFLKRVLGASFALPLIATFTAEEIWIDSAMGAPCNLSNAVNMTCTVNTGNTGNTSNVSNVANTGNTREPYLYFFFS